MTYNQILPLSFYKDHKYFRHTLDLLKNHPNVIDLLAIHAAVLVRGNNIIATGINRPKSNGLVRAYAPHDRMTIHAEVDCILRARKKHDLNGCTIYVARKLKAKDLMGMSKPCETCHKILQQYGVRHVYYTNKQGTVEYLDTTKEYHKNKFWHTFSEI